jgi:hypothetical protein
MTTIGLGGYNARAHRHGPGDTGICGAGISCLKFKEFDILQSNYDADWRSSSQRAMGPLKLDGVDHGAETRGYAVGRRIC